MYPKETSDIHRRLNLNSQKISCVSKYIPEYRIVVAGQVIATDGMVPLHSNKKAQRDTASGLLKNRFLVSGGALVNPRIQ